MVVVRLSNIYTVTKYIMLSSRHWIYASLAFTLMFPILWLILLRVVGNPQYMGYFIVGTVVNTSFLVPFLGTSQDIAYFRRGSAIYALLFSNGADHWDIALGYITQLIALNLPSVVSLLILSTLIIGTSYGVVQVLATVATAVFISLSSALLGYALAMGIRNYRIVNQAAQVIPWPLLLLAPVYYPITILPPVLRYVSLALPTTYMALAINGSLSLNSMELIKGLLGLLAYSSASILIARYAVIRGEVNG
ncbi:ABC-2 type transporter [Caldivirga maquilingensis IC-167]|uniref:ABC-2 type transporter n=1 Tax=Caldivirga maquilingensis (strain ATCC 700844 / DSM 13496 / JCM 10307 / IC-167) TaxID=397948 RepID=A8M9G4_CALMQ|nr:ABC-2 type transporter [Caldivirga maquilingensis IC-167]